MQFIIFSCLLALVIAVPSDYGRQERYDDSREHIAIIRDDRQHADDGSFNYNVETANGIYESRSGARLDNVEYNPIGQQGEYSFTLPNGELFSLKFVADENGFQPESSHLPVAPAFPHPIPQFVIDQIEKAAREDAEGARGYGDSRERVPAPSNSYSSRF